MGASAKVWRQVFIDLGVTDIDALPDDPAVLKAAIRVAKERLAAEKADTSRSRTRTIAKRFRQNAGSA